jgi:putative transposase
MVTHPGDYRWSSYRYHANGHPNSLIHDHAQFLALGRTEVERQTVYRDLFHIHMDAAIITAIRTTTNQCLVLGSERFKDQIEQALSRRVRHGRAGRPKKEIAV